MTLSAHDVAAALRERLPGLERVKLHKLLYYCQGHHLAAMDAPLFAETIKAWKMGPVVEALWQQERDEGVRPGRRCLDEAALNTIGYVVSRYGRLSGNDLARLSHAEAPWKDARGMMRRNQPIRMDSIKAFFRSEADADTDPVLRSPQLAAIVAGARARRDDVLPPDTLESLQARLAARD